jgi:glutathione S-transferase
MTIIMYDLAGAELDRRISPYCWRARMALAHKGFDVETVPCRFLEKDKLPKPNDGKVPIIVDAGRVVHDSWAIADYLDERYQSRPSLFGGDAARGLARFVQEWMEAVIRPGLARLALLDGVRQLEAADQVYFRSTREPRIGMTMEDLVKDRESRLPAFRASLDPFRRTLERQQFIAGEAPAYADYIVFGDFQWARTVSDFEVLAADDPVRTWRGRMLDLFDGLARRVPGYGT